MTIFNAEMYGQVCAEWEEQFNVHEHNLAPLDLTLVKQLVDTSFRTSMDQDEGRPVVFSVLLITQEEAEKSDFFFSTLRDPALFSENNLRSLSAAFDPRVSALLVSYEPGKAQLTIWGYASFTKSVDQFVDIPVRTSGDSNWPPRFRLTVEGPGEIAIGIGDYAIGFLRFGEFSKASSSPYSINSMGKLLYEMIREHPGFKKHSAMYWRSYREALIYLLSKVHRIGHGGTVILCPDALLRTPHLPWEGGYAPEARLTTCALLEELVPGRDDPVFYVALQTRIQQQLDAIAQLACIDGALILNTQLKPVAFGARLNSPYWKGDSFEGWSQTNPYPRQFPLSAHGTRHNSAAGLVAQLRETLAFVISSDGPIRCFAFNTSSNRLECWPDLRASRRL